MEWVATHSWPLVLCIITNTSMLIAWWFWRSCQAWAHILGGLWPEWRESVCIDCIPGLSDLSYASTRHMKWVTTHSWPLILVLQPTPPCDTFGGLQILQNLGPHLRWYVNWMEGIPVCKLHHRHVRPSPCLHKTCQVYGN